MSDQAGKAHTYVAHNYDAMNQAIDTQLDKQFELSELYRFQQTSRRTLMLMHISVSLCVIILTSVLVWWLLAPGNGLPLGAYISTNEYSLKGSDDRGTSDALTIISSTEDQSSNPEHAFINTSFTVFHRTLVPTGEYVVTGKTYQPDDLRRPQEQYCYLEKSQATEQLSGLPLAFVENKKVTLETNKDELIKFAKLYCQFSS